ncbi:hypothetical protein [Actinophytocola oryzae]|uniref:Uncharacterized protein n=1 Tax=Actinophytocola oryzae TaxID=502181 RepID=A0A4R7W1R9_9PSEU|nr:hypothetical protein [Actinophytocola oryzae]TDV56424.1 hypothetical protein CLV71_102491 [Actinophytocola oryzae]
MTTFSQAELDRMCRPPGQRLSDALREGGPAEVKAVYRLMENLIRDITDLYARWSAVTVGWLIDRHGYDGAARAFPVHELWPSDGVPHLTGTEAVMARDVLRGPDSATAADFATLADTGDEDAIVLRWQEIHAASYTAETLRRDTVTALLTLVNDTYGTEGLEDCLRYATDVIWAPRMGADLARAPEDRLRSWAEKMSVGHNGGVTVVEEPDRWVFTLDPCGSCGRQILDGRYRDPWRFGVVRGRHPVGFLREDITVYQAHVAMAHTIVPIERVGAPWPAMRCAGLAATPCELAIYRDPHTAGPEYYEQVGLTPRPTTH